MTSPARSGRTVRVAAGPTRRCLRTAWVLVTAVLLTACGSGTSAVNLRPPNTSQPSAVPSTQPSAIPPTPAPSTPTPPPTTTSPARTNPLDLLGTTFDNPAVTDYLALHGCATTGWGWRCPSDGTELNFTTAQRLSTVFFMSPRRAQGSGYTGPLPGGLTWDDTHADTVVKLGPPGQVIDSVGTSSSAGWHGTVNGLPVQLVVTYRGTTVTPTSEIDMVQVGLQR